MYTHIFVRYISLQSKSSIHPNNINLDDDDDEEGDTSLTAQTKAATSTCARFSWVLALSFTKPSLLECPPAPLTQHTQIYLAVAPLPCQTTPTRPPIGWPGLPLLLTLPPVCLARSLQPVARRHAPFPICKIPMRKTFTFMRVFGVGAALLQCEPAMLRSASLCCWGRRQRAYQQSRWSGLTEHVATAWPSCPLSLHCGGTIGAVIEFRVGSCP